MTPVEQDEFIKMTEHYKDTGGLADIERQVTKKLQQLCQSGTEEKMNILNNGQVSHVLYCFSAT